MSGLLITPIIKEEFAVSKNTLKVPLLLRLKAVFTYFLITVLAVCSFFPTPVLAQEMLPHPDEPFAGKIGLSYKDSEAVKPELLKPQNFGIENPPNIVIALIDDAGFGQFHTFGGATPSPNLDYLAENGIRYNRFHTTALCAPTRSALLTGHNHHSAANGALPESGTGFPGYNSVIPDSTATIAQVLHEYGYDTSWFGKDHNVPQWETSLAGPFDHWPTSLGFDYFYGFVGGSTDQYHPASLVENTTRIDAPSTNADGSSYHLTTDLADHAVDYIKKLNAVAPEKPFFTYFATGATHAPHQVPPEWIDKIQSWECFDGEGNPCVGNFDDYSEDDNDMFNFSLGWDKYREETFKNQQNLGVVPQSAELSQRPCSLAAWDEDDADNCYTLPGDPTLAGAIQDDEDIVSGDVTVEAKKAVYTNMMEVFSAFTAQTDDAIGRVIQAIDDIGKLDNTLVFYIAGDNGSSAEGELEGLLNELSVFNQIDEDFQTKVDLVTDDDSSNDLGTQNYYNHFPAAWAWAMDTPFQWTKQIASHFGGTRNGMVVSWPNGIDSSQNGTVHDQFGHVIDIMPTILEAVGISAPVEVNGIAQKPIEGKSLVYSFNDPAAENRHTTQYFELFGNQGIYSDGWMASAIRSIPWESTPLPNDLLDMPWELYCIEDDCDQYSYEVEVPIPDELKKIHDFGKRTTVSTEVPLYSDFAQANNVAEYFPEKLDEMVKLFFAQASLYNVLPLDDRKIQRYDVALRPSWIEGMTSFSYPDHLRVTEGAAPDVRGVYHVITADVDLSKADESADTGGMLVTFGGRFGGYALYVNKDGKLVYCYNYADSYHDYIESDEVLPTSGHASLQMIYTPDPSDTPATTGDNTPGATITLQAKYDGDDDYTEIGGGHIEHNLLSRFTIDETMDIGYDTGSRITDDENYTYDLPFEFNGTLNTLTVDLSGN